MSTAVSEPTAKSLCWVILSVLAQQAVFAALAFSYPLLLWVSAWVVKIPVVILWVLAFVSSLTFVTWTGARHYFHVVAKRGWLFVLAAAVWVACYWWFSEREGTPVSYDAMKAHYERR